jgi:hypothetical protein
MAPRPWGTSTGIEWGGPFPTGATVLSLAELSTKYPGKYKQWVQWPGVHMPWCHSQGTVMDVQFDPPLPDDHCNCPGGRGTFDNTRARIAELDDSRIEVVTDWFPRPRGQHQHLINDIILPCYGACEVVIMEPDLVWHDWEIRHAFDQWEDSGQAIATPKQVELWRTPQWRIPERRRDAAWFVRLNGPIGLTGGNGWIEGQPYAHLPAHVHNFGFCYSEKVMLWKHLTAMAFSSEINDAPPNPDWYERVWLNWKPGDTNLEISRGEEHTIPAAYPYPVEELPAVIRRKYGI